jgi:uncharacterized protein YqhQ
LTSKKLDVGGQAVIEGVMMRGPKSMVIAVRRMDGSIAVKDSQWVPLTQRRMLKWLKWPLIRGASVMVEALINGMQALSFSANVAMEDEEAEIAKKKAEEAEEAGEDAPVEAEPEAKKAGGEALTKGAIALSLTLSLALGIGLFIYLPHWGAAAIFNGIRGLPIGAEAPVSEPLFHVLVGAIKMLIFVAYIAGIRRMKDIRRVFQYHGAEHKSIHVYEAGEELTVENARKYPTFHPRCGTSFLVFVILISIFFFAGVFPLIQPFLPDVEGWRANLMQASIKIPLMLPIAGLSYEFIKWAGKRKSSGVMAFFAIPGRLVQKLTTIYPDDDQVEVAMVSLKRALEHEGALTDPDYGNVTFLTDDEAVPA